MRRAEPLGVNFDPCIPLHRDRRVGEDREVIGRCDGDPVLPAGSDAVAARGSFRIGQPLFGLLKLSWKMTLALGLGEGEGEGDGLGLAFARSCSRPAARAAQRRVGLGVVLGSALEVWVGTATISGIGFQEEVGQRQPLLRERTVTLPVGQERAADELAVAGRTHNRRLTGCQNSGGNQHCHAEQAEHVIGAAFSGASKRALKIYDCHSSDWSRGTRR